MAQFPCSHCRERYRGPQQTAYPSIVNGTDREGGKQRLCPRCLQRLDGWVQERMVPYDAAEGDELCIACHGPNPDWAVFLTIYRTGQEREDWYGRVHSVRCAPVARNALFEPVAAP